MTQIAILLASVFAFAWVRERYRRILLEKQKADLEGLCQVYSDGTAMALRRLHEVTASAVREGFVVSHTEDGLALRRRPSSALN